MRDGVRTLISALLILVGGLLVVMWAIAGVAVQAVEDGTAVSGIAQRAMDDPAVVEELGERAADEAVAALERRGVELDRVGLELALRLAVEEAIASDAFRDVVLNQVGRIEDQFTTALTESLRVPQPFVITVDLSTWINSTVDGIPVVGAAIPDVTIDPLEVEAIDQETFTTVRTAYAVIQWLGLWGVWVGIALIVVGMFVTRRFRWFLSKVGLAIAAFAGAGLLALRWWGADAVAGLIPGAGGAVSTLLEEIITESTVPLIESRLLTVLIWAGIGALVFFLIGVLTMPREKRR